ncbi:MAG TPA: hypothetical protein VN706_04935 [Gemmatimonadaceae bacterium]|nr:hypothetical protein [Gemmatimonadaceae bacterium]
MSRTTIRNVSILAAILAARMVYDAGHHEYHYTPPSDYVVLGLLITLAAGPYAGFAYAANTIAPRRAGFACGFTLGVTVVGFVLMTSPLFLLLSMVLLYSGGAGSSVGGVLAVTENSVAAFAKIFKGGASIPIALLLVASNIWLTRSLGRLVVGSDRTQSAWRDYRALGFLAGVAVLLIVGAGLRFHASLIYPVLP